MQRPSEPTKIAADLTIPFLERQRLLAAGFRWQIIDEQGRPNPAINKHAAKRAYVYALNKWCEWQEANIGDTKFEQDRDDTAIPPDINPDEEEAHAAARAEAQWRQLEGDIMSGLDAIKDKYRADCMAEGTALLDSVNLAEERMDV